MTDESTQELNLLEGQSPDATEKASPRKASTTRAKKKAAPIKEKAPATRSRKAKTNSVEEVGQQALLSEAAQIANDPPATDEQLTPPAPVKKKTTKSAGARKSSKTAKNANGAENPEPVIAATATIPAAPVEMAPATPSEVAPGPVHSTPTSEPAATGEPARESEADEAPPAEAGAVQEGPPRRLSWRERRILRFKQRRERERELRNGGGTGASQGEASPPEATSESSAAPGQDQQQQRPPEKPLGPPEAAEGMLEMSPKGYGFLRERGRGFNATPNDVFVSPEWIRKYGLREGMYMKGEARKGHRGPQLTDLTEVNGRVPDAMKDLPLFEELRAVNPNKRIQLETRTDRLTTRVIDMITPVGRGQRGLIVAPPRAGKTTLLQHVAEAVIQNHPGMHLMLLLVDERPEEVTEFKRLLPTAEIFASSNDMDVKSHCRIAQLAIERAKRLVECGDHVFILMDSITRLGRAFNNASKGGATMSGGMGVGALEVPRRLFAAARNTRQAGSLTILATALIETGSRMDDLIFQEFKGTGNMELILDRKIAEQFVYPAVNILKSGTRREELLLQAFQLDKIHMLRRGLAGHKPIEAVQRVISLLERYPSNAQMLVDLPSKAS